MSKVDAQRALRDARYAKFAAERTAGSTARSSTAAAVPVKKKPAPEAELVELFAVEPTPPPKPAAVSTEVAAQPVAEVSPGVAAEAEPAAEPETAPVAEAAAEPESPEAGLELCGHRSINGRSCTRDKGHPQKNHRYN